MSSAPLTLLAAGSAQPGARLLRRVGVSFDLVPLNSHGPLMVTGLKPPSRSLKPKALTVAPRREAWIQFDFRMGECESFPPDSKRTYNRDTVIRYRLRGRVRTMRLDLEGVQVTITAPPRGKCPAQ